ncbi:PLxRFG domain-containing protein [Paracoccus contaminans]|uniref:DdrB-like domain-containing protein n=1 Tax=Paracoccus contaminans TaxID=1945662 RepID=A0A1W6CZX7_9RHOB|nr:PLxRFG domain-containing protein [Paracoccus contaminans]ARJ70433.1 hypothetical protein B0A89_13095 [Paracoccus contaminans]
MDGAVNRATHPLSAPLTAARAAGPVTHTTAKGKVKTGYVLQGVTKAKADEIDPYSFRKDGGVFVNADRADEWERTAAPAVEPEATTPAPVATEDADNGPRDPQFDRDGAEPSAAPQPAAVPESVSGPTAQTQQNAAKVGGRSADQSAVKTAPPVRSGSGRDFLASLNRAKGKAKAAIRDAGTADYLAPGNIIASYGGGHDRVIAFDPATKDITVQAVKRDDTGGWVDAPGEGQRTHRTLPDDRQLANGPVQRAERPAGSPEEISPAPQQVQAETGDDQGNVQELHTAQPTGEITRKPIKPGKAITARGREIAVEYALVELDDLTASQLDDGRDNPAFPQELQPRDRSGNRSQEQIRKIAADIRPELLGENPQASAGAPIATKGGVVISGNGRTLALRRAYAEGTADGYRAWLKSQGYPEGGFKRPVLVRTINEDMDTDTLAATAREANERDTQAMSASEQAMADAKVLSPAVLDLYRGGEVDAAGNRDFVRGFLGQVVAPAEMGNLIRDDGSMTQDAVRRVQAALLARAYGDADLVSAVMEATDGSIKAIGGALMDVAPRWAQMRDAAKDSAIAPEMDQTEALLEAVRIVDRARRAGRKVDEFVGQGDMFSGDAVSPMGKAFLTLMFRDAPASYRTARGRERLARGLILFADEGMRSQPGTDMLGATADPIGAAAGVRRKLVDDERKADAVRKGQGGLFAAGDVSDGAGDGQDVPAGAGPAGPAEPADAGRRDPQAGEGGQREGLTTDFVRAPDGSLSFGEITAKIAERIGRQGGHIRLRSGDPAKGLQHIEQRHGEHIRSLGYPSVEAFVSQVGRGFQAVYARQGRALDPVMDDGKKGLLIVQLEPDASGDFYDVRTATPIRRGQYAKKKPLWESAGPSVSPIDGPLDPKGQNGTDNVGAEDGQGKTSPLSTAPVNAGPGAMEQRDIDRQVPDEVVGAGQKPAVNLNPGKGQVFAPALEGSADDFNFAFEDASVNAERGGVGTRTQGPMGARESRVEPDMELGADTLNIGVPDSAVNSDPLMYPAPNPEPVATLTGNELGPWEDMLQLSKKAESWYRKNLIGTVAVMKSTGWHVQFGRTGSKKLGGRKGDVILRAVPALRQMIEGAKLVSTRSGEKPGTERQTFHKVSATVSIDGQPYRLIATLREDANGTFHYDLSTDRGDAEGGAANRVAEARSGSTSRQSGDGGVKQQSASMGGQAAYGLEDNPVEINLDIAPAPVNAHSTITPEAARRINAAAAEALDRAGLLGKIGLRVEAGRVTGAGGTYAKGVISILRDRGRGWLHTLDHEMIHALRDGQRWGASHGLFTADEWRALVQAARADADLMAAVRAAYPDLDAAGQMEEAVAEMFADWAAGRREVDGGPLRSALEAIRSFFRAVASALRGEGFEDAARVMERIARGEVGGRGPGGPGGGGGYDRQSPRRTERSTARLRDLWGDRSPSPRLGTLNMDADHDSVKDQRKPSLTVADVIAAAKRPGHAPEKAETGAAAEWVTRAAEDAGIDMSGLRHVIDGSAVRHIFGRHGGASSEARRGQVAITESDIEQIGAIIADPDAVAFGSKTRIGREAITYIREMPDGTVLLVEEIRQSRGEAAVNTMWKKAPAAKDAYALKRILLSNVRNDGGTVVKVFTKAEAVKEQRDLSEVRAALTARARKAGQAFGSQGWRKGGEFWSDLLTDAMGRSTRWNVLSLVPGRPLFKELGRNLLAAQSYIAHKDEMDAQRTAWHARAADTAQEWMKLRRKDADGNRAFMDLLHEATIAQVDPSNPFEPRNVSMADPEGVAREAARARAHADLSARFKALPEGFRAMWGRVRGDYDAIGDAFEDAILKNIELASEIAVRRAQRDHAKALREIDDEGLTGAERDAAIAEADARLAKIEQSAKVNGRARLQKLRAVFEGNRLSGPYVPLARHGQFFVTVRDENGKVVSFSLFETAGAQRAFAAEAEKTAPGRVQHGVMSESADLRRQVDPSFVADVEGILADTGASPEVMDAIWQRWLETLPDQSIRKSSIHRKGRAGYSTDALRAYGDHLFHGGHQLAKLQWGLRLEDDLDEATEEAKRQPDPNRAQAVVNEMRQRHAFTMNPQGSPLIAAASGMAFTLQLAASPAAALVNITQTTVVGAPMLAARFQKAGVPGVARHLMRAMRDFTRAKGYLENSNVLTGDEKAALDEALRRGVIDRTQAHSLAEIADHGVSHSPARDQVQRALGFFFHHAERMNREVTFVAAYRLGREDGLTHAAAIDAATDATWAAHFDAQNNSRPRFMQNDLGKLLTTFRSFQVNMLYRLFRDLHQTFNGATPELRREARLQAVGITLSMFAHAGIRGVWGYALLTTLLSMFLPGDDDDLDAWLQDALLFEGDSLPTTAWNFAMGAVLNGVPGQVTGVDLTNRIGMPELWLREQRDGIKADEAGWQYVKDALGPTIGWMAASVPMGLSDIAEGEYWRGTERIMPKAVRDPMKAARYAWEGVQTKDGDIILENVSPLNVLQQSLGFTPAAVAERYEQANMLRKGQAEINTRRQRLHKRAVDAIKAGEPIPAKVIDEIMAFNRDVPEWPITSETIRASWRGRERAAERAQIGVNLNPRLTERLTASLPKPVPTF